MSIDPMELSNFDLLSNLQGNTLKGHGRNHTTHIFIQFDNNKINQAKDWIRNFASENIVSMLKQLKEREVFKRNQIAGDLFAGLYLTASGYKALGFTPPPEASFNAGMKNPSTSAKLKDPAANTWDPSYNTDIHAMILLADDDTTRMGNFSKNLIDNITKTFGNVLHIEYGHAIRNVNGDGIEHFGYADGVSQPLFLKDEVDEFNKNKPLPLAWNPEASIDLILIDDPNVANTEAHAKGSYFVYRKLEQKVKAFNQAEEDLADSIGLKDDEKERAGAMIVGRYEDGTLLTLNEEDGIIASGLENNFNYDADAAGAKCPFHAHIRKSNPRGAGIGSVEDDKTHIMARRGIPYGLRNVDTSIPPSIPQMPDDGVGLLFMSFQADISNQFEFIQSNWVNNENFPHAHAGSDPILGQGILSNGEFAVKYGDASTLTRKPFNSFVTLKGGEYFFAPSIIFLKTLA